MMPTDLLLEAAPPAVWHAAHASSQHTYAISQGRRARRTVRRCSRRRHHFPRYTGAQKTPPLLLPRPEEQNHVRNEQKQCDRHII